MLTKLLLNKWTWIIIAVIAAIIYVYSIIQENRELRAENQIRRQNEAALQDSLTKKVDSIQVLAVKVEDLKSESDEWENKYRATYTKYQISIDTIKVLRKRADSVKVIGDSIGIVHFSGKQSIATYKGSTTINIKSQENEHSIEITFSDVDAEATLFYDETDGLWKMRTLSLTPGIKLRGLSTIDNEMFRKIQGLKPIETKIPSTIAVGGLFAYDRVYGGIILSPSKWMFSINYKLFDKYLESESWSDKIMIGVHYFIW